MRSCFHHPCSCRLECREAEAARSPSFPSQACSHPASCRIQILGYPGRVSRVPRSSDGGYKGPTADRSPTPLGGAQANERDQAADGPLTCVHQTSGPSIPAVVKILRQPTETNPKRLEGCSVGAPASCLGSPLPPCLQVWEAEGCMGGYGTVSFLACTIM